MVEDHCFPGSLWASWSLGKTQEEGGMVIKVLIARHAYRLGERWAELLGRGALWWERVLQEEGTRCWVGGCIYSWCQGAGVEVG